MLNLCQAKTEAVRADKASGELTVVLTASQCFAKLCCLATCFFLKLVCEALCERLSLPSRVCSHTCPLISSLGPGPHFLCNLKSEDCCRVLLSSFWETRGRCCVWVLEACVLRVSCVRVPVCECVPSSRKVSESMAFLIISS